VDVVAIYIMEGEKRAREVGTWEWIHFWDHVGRSFSNMSV
jgi:hypothetical protein